MVASPTEPISPRRALIAPSYQACGYECPLIREPWAGFRSRRISGTAARNASHVGDGWR